MKRQKGAALIVVLSLLTISLMVGLSSMQSSQINEKLASNYKAQAESVMNAETGISDFFSQYKQCSEVESAIASGFGGLDEGYELENSSSHPSVVDTSSGNFEIYMRGFSDNEQARALVRADGLCEVSLSFLRSRGAFVCPVGSCGFQQGASVNGGISGFDHSLEDTTSCTKDIRDDQDREDRAGAIFTDTDFSSQGYTEEDIDNLNVVGDPNYLAAIDSDGDGVIDADHVDAFFNASYMSDLLDEAACSDLACRSGQIRDAMEVIGEDAQAIMDAVAKGAISGDIHVVNVGEEFTVDGRFDGVILMNGGKLVLKGNSCVVGAVVGRGDAEAESAIESSGRPSIIGTVISNGNLTFTGKGRPDVSFSSEVLSTLDEEINLTINDFDLVGWEDYSGVID